jgi:hypothetical protein
MTMVAAGTVIRKATPIRQSTKNTPSTTVAGATTACTTSGQTWETMLAAEGVDWATALANRPEGTPTYQPSGSRCR